jgi:hypothetical protein
LLWILGVRGVRDYEALPPGKTPTSQSFPYAGTYVLRDGDLYLLFNASDSGINGRGSHGHNDALSIEVSAYGTAFIIDPGSHIYTSNLGGRHLFRSTAYHSTVQVDRQEQNTIDEAMPFIIGNEARPRALNWETNAETDTVVAEHYGYRRLSHPVTHRRTVRFDKRRRFWLIEDELTGEGAHQFSVRFHVAPGIDANVRPDGMVQLYDKINRSRLLIRCQKPDRKEGQPAGVAIEAEPVLESQFSSHDYGQRALSVSVCWKTNTAAPIKMEFALIPVSSEERQDERLATVSEAHA